MIRVEAQRHFNSNNKIESVTLRYFTDQYGAEAHVATERVRPEDFPEIADGLRSNGAQVNLIWEKK